MTEGWPGLYSALWETGDQDCQSLLDDWLGRHRAQIEALQAFGIQADSVIPNPPDYLHWGLYAASRIIQMLQLPFQPPRFAAECAGVVSLRGYENFLAALGARPVEAGMFDPFFHEIVEVDQSADPTARIELVEVLWPAHMLNGLLISRSGVRVSGGSHHIDKTVAENSVMFWGFCRRNRDHSDLSHGWGSNSQWATRARRDYQVGRQRFLNVDAKPVEPEGRWDGLADASMSELLTHWSFILPHPKIDYRSQDFWPYDISITIDIPEGAA